MNTITSKINRYREWYIKEYGERKYRKVLAKISSSKRITKLLQTSIDKQLAPNQKDFIYSLNEIPFFIISKPDTFAMGTILALELWHNSINIGFSLLDEYNLERVFNSIVFETRSSFEI